MKHFTTAMYEESDGYKMHFIMDNDAIDGWLLGEMDNVIAVRDALDRLIESGNPDEVIKDTDERIHKWYSISDAVSESGIPYDTIYSAARSGHIADATQVDGSKKWRFPQQAFRSWERNRPKPGPKPAEPPKPMTFKAGSYEGWPSKNETCIRCEKGVIQQYAGSRACSWCGKIRNSPNAVPFSHLDVGEKFYSDTDVKLLPYTKKSLFWESGNAITANGGEAGFGPASMVIRVDDVELIPATEKQLKFIKKIAANCDWFDEDLDGITKDEASAIIDKYPKPGQVRCWECGIYVYPKQCPDGQWDGSMGFYCGC